MTWCDENDGIANEAGVRIRSGIAGREGEPKVPVQLAMRREWFATTKVAER